MFIVLKDREGLHSFRSAMFSCGDTFSLYGILSPFGALFNYCRNIALLKECLGLIVRDL